MAFLRQFAMWLKMDPCLITDGKGIAVHREDRSLQTVNIVAKNANYISGEMLLPSS